ncbi:hypothetical protein GGI43DRAFT_427797, partial [Trichoderma evansii]
MAIEEIAEGYPILFVPGVFQTKNKKTKERVFLMSATHRGDMYHLRAALQLENRSVILYDSDIKNKNKEDKWKTKDLEDYLVQSVLRPGRDEKDKQYIFVVPWTYDEINGRGKDKDGKAKTAPTDFAGCFLNGVKYNGTDPKNTIQKIELRTYSEGSATQFISNCVPDNKELPNNLINGMDIPPDIWKHIRSDEITKMSEGFKRIWEAARITPDEKGDKNAILFMYRDTGIKRADTVAKMGAYPELDTGNTIKEIKAIVEKIAKQEKTTINFYSCGLKIASEEEAKTNPGIGFYWEDIEKLKPSNDKITTRDFEAYFLKWSYDNKYYKMASGFRSGALDLFTFMGIPTLSIGLRNLKGEDRHALLARKEFKRVNIQYDQPRHNTTACIYLDLKKVKSKDPNPNLFNSPYWGDEGFFDPPEKAKMLRIPPRNDEGKINQQIEKPRDFAAFDKVVIEIGYRFACHQFLNVNQSVHKIENQLSHIINTRAARLFYINGNKAGQHEYLLHNKEIDQKDIEAMRGKLEDRAGTFQQSEEMIKRYEKEFEEDWKKMERFHV